MTHAITHLGDDILNAWIDDVATPEERAIVQDHIAACETCQERVDELLLVKSMLGSLPEVTPRRSFKLTPDQAKKPIPIRREDKASNIVRLLPIIRTLTVAAALAVIVLGGVLTFGPQNDTITSDANVALTAETGGTGNSLEDQNPAPAEPGSVVDQGESASAHETTSNTLDDEARESATPGDGGISGIEVATITIGVVAILLGIAWYWMSSSLRGGPGSGPGL